ncbi:unnamed protein product [Coregonus sp. 'balchen']|nr:unnamed protein product [Coregonus sp. 'balchen']
MEREREGRETRIGGGGGVGGWGREREKRERRARATRALRVEKGRGGRNEERGERERERGERDRGGLESERASARSQAGRDSARGSARRTRARRTGQGRRGARGTRRGQSYGGDDRSSAASGIDVADRLTYLEQRMQMQDDEIQLLKMALADVLKRLNISEEHQNINEQSCLSEEKLHNLYTTIYLHCTELQPLTRSISQESSAGSVKENPCTSKTARPGPRPGPAGSTAAPGSKKADSKTKEPAASVGLRRVTHCKVTMQIYLSPQTKRTGSSEAAKSAPTVPNSRPTRTPTPPSDQRSPPDLGPDQGRDTQINSFLHPPPAEKHQSKYVFSSGHEREYDGRREDGTSEAAVSHTDRYLVRTVLRSALKWHQKHLHHLESDWRQIRFKRD